MANGGRRPGAGRKKGGKNKKTLELEAAFKHYKERILKEIDPLIESQLHAAKGLTIMMARKWETKKGKRARTGEFVRVSNEYEIKELLNGEGENGEDYYYISAISPDGKVSENLMNRVFGKSKETLEVGFGNDVKEALQKLNAVLK